jgi:hypothetical protein
LPAPSMVRTSADAVAVDTQRKQRGMRDESEPLASCVDDDVP